MDREAVIRMAREAGISESHAFGMFDSLERFAALVAAAVMLKVLEVQCANEREDYKRGRDHEREACAKVCEDMDHNGVMIAADCAAAIRARGEQHD